MVVWAEMTWFQAGSTVGIIVFSPSVQAMIDKISIRWALRISGFIALAVGTLGIAFVRQRVAVRRVQYKVFDASLISTNRFAFFLAYQFLQFFAYAMGVFYLPSELFALFTPGEHQSLRIFTGYCSAINIPPGKAAGVLSVLAAANAIGRVLSGLIADRAGNLNVLIVSNSLAGLVCLVVWLFAKSLSTLMAFAVLWGLFNGGMFCV
jgi:hypothetical protein